MIKTLEVLKKLVCEMQTVIDKAHEEAEESISAQTTDEELARLIARRDEQLRSVREAEEVLEHAKQLLERRRAGLLFREAAINKKTDVL